MQFDCRQSPFFHLQPHPAAPMKAKLRDPIRQQRLMAHCKRRLPCCRFDQTPELPTGPKSAVIFNSAEIFASSKASRSSSAVRRTNQWAAQDDLRRVVRHQLHNPRRRPAKFLDPLRRQLSLCVRLPRLCLRRNRMPAKIEHAHGSPVECGRHAPRAVARAGGTGSIPPLANG